MDVITTHINADFDCLGSMIAAKRLYPEAKMVFPGGQERTLRDYFLKSAQYAYGFQKVKDIDLDQVRRLILVDVRQASRIGPFGKLAKSGDVEVHIFDHHPGKKGGLSGTLEHVEPVGSTVTVLTHLFMEQDIVPSADEATMMMLGLYEDTGNLTFHTTTGKDYQAAAFLLAHGANLNVVSDILVQELTPDQVRLLNDLIANRTVLNVQGIDVSITHASSDHFVADIAALVHKLKDMESLDVLIAVVRMESRVFTIARSRRPEIHVGELLAEFGGGGHASAASGTVKDLTLVQVLELLPQILQRQVQPQWETRHLMSTPVKSVGVDDSIAEARKILTRYNLNAVPVLDDTTVMGVITRQLVDKAGYHGLDDQSVKEYMIGEFHAVSPLTPISILKTLIVESNQRFVPVIDEDRLVGAVTRTDLLRHLATSTGTAPRASGESLIAKGGRRLKSNQILRLIRNRLPVKIQELLVHLGEVADGLEVQVFVVGGFVRDLLLNAENLDLDIVVEGDGIAFAETFARKFDCRVRCHRKFNTAVVIFPNGFKLDVASARMEYYLRPGALPDVEHASVKLDLCRRDFTINTMAIELNSAGRGELLDYYGGQRDLDGKALRVLHNLSFVEDPTRLFRAVRFEQRLGFKIGKQTEHLMQSAVRFDFLERVTGRRIFNEIFQILNEKDPLPAVERLAFFDLLRTLHQSLGKKVDYRKPFLEMRRIMDWYDLLYTGDACRGWFCYLLSLTATLDTGGMATLCKRLQFSERDRDILVGQRQTGLRVLYRLERRRSDSRPPRPSDLYRWFEPLTTEVLLFLMAQSRHEHVRQWVSRYITHLRDVTPLLSGHDLEKIGLSPGPDYKIIFDELLAARLNGQVTTVEDEQTFVRRKFKKLIV
jgi:tRNA nucleotidyltransferase (CCA-adding enzyme)